MSTASNRDRVLAVLRISVSVPLDDDQLSARAGVQPRQTVNMVCRRLEREGVLKRYVGVDGKIVNELVVPTMENAAIGGEQHVDDPVVRDAPGAAAVTNQLEHPTPPGNSDEQRAAERVMLDLLGAELGMVLNPARIAVPSGERVEVDGVNADRTVVVECWARQGAPKAAQRNKVLSDAFKLSWIGTVLYPRPRRILCLSDPAAAAPFLPGARTWAARALHDLGIDVIVVTLSDTLRETILNAQRRQYR